MNGETTLLSAPMIQETRLTISRLWLQLQPPTLRVVFEDRVVQP